MSWLTDQVAQYIVPAQNDITQGAATSAGDITAGQTTSAADLAQGSAASAASLAAGLNASNLSLANGTTQSQQDIANQQAANTAQASPFIANGTTAMDQYLNALGLSYQTSPGTQAQAAQAAVAPTYAQISNPSQTGYLNPQGQLVQAVYPGASMPNTLDYMSGTGTPASSNAQALANLYDNPIGMYEDPTGLNNVTDQSIVNGLMNSSTGITAANLAAAGFTPLTMGTTAATTTNGAQLTPGSPAQAAVAATPGTYSTPSSPASILAAFQNTPGYQNMLQTGLAGVNSNAASQGLLGSGAQGQALTQYAENYAQNGYQTYLSNLLGAANTGNTASGQLMSANSGLAGQGASSATSLANQGSSAATSLANQGSSSATSLANQGSSAATSSATAAAQLAQQAAQNQAELSAGNMVFGNTASLGFGNTVF